MSRRKITPFPEGKGTMMLGTPEGNKSWRQMWDHIHDVMVSEFESDTYLPTYRGKDTPRSKRKMPRLK